MELLTDTQLTQRAADVYFAYADAVDTGDIVALTELLADGVKITRSGDTVEGVEAFLDVYRAHWALETLCRHIVTNVRTKRAGDEIETRAYFESTMFGTDDTKVIFGRYSDVLVEERGALKISHKILTVQRVLHLPATVTQFAHVQPD